MELIKDDVFEKIISRIELKTDEKKNLVKLGSENYTKYFFLDKYPEKFCDEDPLNIYYNKYYFFLSFLKSHLVNNDYDAGLEQQEFKIIEEGESYPEIDWQIVEQISKLKGD